MDECGYIDPKDYGRYGLDKITSFEDIYWSSDWNGDEVGYDDIDVVGLYSLKDWSVYFYIDVSTMEILEAWLDPEMESEIDIYV